MKIFAYKVCYVFFSTVILQEYTDAMWKTVMFYALCKNSDYSEVFMWSFDWDKEGLRMFHRVDFFLKLNNWLRTMDSPLLITLVG